MEPLLKICGASIWPIFFLISYILIKSTPRKSKISSFSDLGSSKEDGTKFNVLLIATGLFQIAFLSGHLQRFGLSIAFLMATSFFGILSGIIRQKGHLLTHKTICAIGFVLSSFGWITLGLEALYINKTFGALFFAWGMTIVPLLLYAVFQKKPLLKYEVIFFFGAFLTNLILLVLN